MSERDEFEAWAKAYGRIFLNVKPKLGREGVMYENQFTQEAWVGWQARAALAQQQVPQGWKLVPNEPTHQMLNAFCDAPLLDDGPESDWRKSYRAMLAAAPPAPHAEQPRQTVGLTPIEPGRIEREFHASLAKNYYDFHDGVRFAERHHGIPAPKEHHEG